MKTLTDSYLNSLLIELYNLLLQVRQIGRLHVELGVLLLKQM